MNRDPAGSDARPGDLLIAQGEWTQIVIADPRAGASRIDALSLDMFTSCLKITARARVTYNLVLRP